MKIENKIYMIKLIANSSIDKLNIVRLKKAKVINNSTVISKYIPCMPCFEILSNWINCIRNMKIIPKIYPINAPISNKKRYSDLKAWSSKTY
jgi:hypothetical protein